MQILNGGYGGRVFADKASGAYIWINGKKCIDFSMGAGSHLFGHAPKFIQSAISDQMKNGTLLMHPHKLAHDYASEFKATTGHESMVFCNTGTEAVMRAFRIARARTGKNVIALFDGGWHGSSDGTLWMDYKFGVPVLPNYYRSYKRSKKYTNKTLDDLKKDKDDLAMVFLEIIPSSHIDYDPEFLMTLREFCTDNKILLGFDEIITGIRVGTEIMPDIATYGKIFGGGFPIGIVAGKKVVTSVINHGVFMGGTFSGNPISLRAGLEVMKRIDIKDLLNLFAKAKAFRDHFNKYSTHLHLQGIGSFMRLNFTKKDFNTPEERKELEPGKYEVDMFLSFLREEGVYIGPNRLMFLSFAHSDKDIKKSAEILLDCEEYFYRNG